MLPCPPRGGGSNHPCAVKPAARTSAHPSWSWRGGRSGSPRLPSRSTRSRPLTPALTRRGFHQLGSVKGQAHQVGLSWREGVPHWGSLVLPMAEGAARAPVMAYGITRRLTLSERRVSDRVIRENLRHGGSWGIRRLRAGITRDASILPRPEQSRFSQTEPAASVGGNSHHGEPPLPRPTAPAPSYPLRRAQPENTPPRRCLPAPPRGAAKCGESCGRCWPRREPRPCCRPTRGCWSAPAPRVNPDDVAGHLLRQRLGEGDDASFGGDVGGLARHAHPVGVRHPIDDDAARALRHHGAGTPRVPTTTAVRLTAIPCARPAGRPCGSGPDRRPSGRRWWGSGRGAPAGTGWPRPPRRR